MERESLAAVAEESSVHENARSPPSIFKPKASPKPRLFSALKKDGRLRSNSAALHVRRCSTDSILGERMDSIGRRLSRDLTNSPPDLGHRFESFGKVDAAEKYDTISGAKGLSKSNEILTTRCGTFSGKTAEKANIASKPIKSGKRPKISFESYHRDADKSPIHEEHELTPVTEILEPFIYHEDRSAALLRKRLHNELRSEYTSISNTDSQESSIIEKKSSNNINSSVRPPLPKKNQKHYHQRQKSLDNLDTRNNGGTSSKVSPQGSIDKNLLKSTQRSQVSLQRLSREDLLRLSQSSQSEIHEYLAEPP